MRQSRRYRFAIGGGAGVVDPRIARRRMHAGTGAHVIDGGIGSAARRHLSNVAN